MTISQPRLHPGKQRGCVRIGPKAQRLLNLAWTQGLASRASPKMNANYTRTARDLKAGEYAEGFG